MAVIDFTRFSKGSIQDRKQIASEVDDAFKTTGFFFIQNHGISQSRIDACFKQSKNFFDLPEHEKHELTPTPHSFEQGYIGIKKEKIRGKECMKENFDFRDPTDSSLGHWPNEARLPGFRGIATDFYQDCSKLMGEILECVDLALGLDSTESLSQHHNGSMFVSNLIRYPRISAASVRSCELIRDASHSDLSTLSLHFQHDVSGFQVANMSTTTKTSSSAVGETAEFYDVELNPKLIIVNVGFLLQRWTNKRWKNSVHRVSVPLSDTGAVEGSIPDQHSIAFYGFPHAKTTIAPLSSYSDEDVPDRPEPFVAGEYLLRKRVELYT